MFATAACRFSQASATLHSCSNGSRKRTRERSLLTGRATPELAGAAGTPSSSRSPPAAFR